MVFDPWLSDMVFDPWSYLFQAWFLIHGYSTWCLIHGRIYIIKGVSEMSTPLGIITKVNYSQLSCISMNLDYKPVYDSAYIHVVISTDDDCYLTT